MTQVALQIGILLIVLGLSVFGYYQQVTALIPSFLGLAYVILGWFGQRFRFRRFALASLFLLSMLALLSSSLKFVEQLFTFDQLPLLLLNTFGVLFCSGAYLFKTIQGLRAYRA